MRNSTKENITAFIKKGAADAGFSYCGISKAGQLEEEARLLEKWLNQNRHGKMFYMENHFDMRIDPTKLVPDSKSVISLMYNYFTEEKQTEEADYHISTYAFGEDYHVVIKDKLYTFINEIKHIAGDFHSRIFVDSAPVLEKAWAQKSGLGWQGKNTNIINPRSGSFFFLAEIICDLELIYDGPMKDYCGSCTACVDACPTDALHEPYYIDATKCISYLTIELKDEFISSEFKGKMENRIFGCDICQDVCPWNRFSTPHKENKFIPQPELLDLKKKDWDQLSEESFNRLFKDSPVQRTKFKGLKRNIDFLQ
ncbi:MAG: tRNA epoxyqueuosine(34) reductase QueG [Chitinophagales bacterium]|nr:tRNA epoxyqueuosine(34) reductase QueG [Bacteroidota bacterium]MBK7569652.1 tRNA epoxyqueuosine(34) reductase QueG [Bacteroidota bacterium]MBP8915646.1 tRNA epoxyqueuosine(34) reductase QueG [Chitinophagales bacterium]MBP9220576.1 tRNA epoxyqueuosine(34) reductase QueG [Chitinophagales bacterium]MBP9794812.1 tRNA epoxyqueuosine(34) reductase QueG [Chitinophagales bacterium]